MAGTRKFSDEELIESIQSGRDSNSAIHFLYDHYFESLANFVVNNQGSRAEAEDIFQEVLVNFIALVKENKFRGESTIGTFLFSINRFSWLNELKRKGRAAAREMKYEQGKEISAPDVSHLVIQKESAQQLEDVMKKLGTNCMKILRSYYYENLSIKEILEQLDYENEQVVRNKKYKCLKELDKMISDNPTLKKTLKNLLNG